MTRLGAASVIRGATLTAVAVAGFSAAARAQDGELGFRAGVEQTSGDYGGGEDVQDLYVPMTLLYERRRLSFRVTIPYLEVEFVDPIDSSTYTESGLGDVVLGVTAYDVFRSAEGSLAIDLTGKVKLGTADEQRGLGTGETDYSVQADVYKFFDRTVLVGSVGYRLRGEPPGVAVENAWLVSLGGWYRFSAATSGGLFVDYRESSVPDADPIGEVTASLSRRLRGRWHVQGYLIRGVSNTSLDWGAGMSVRRGF